MKIFVIGTGNVAYSLIPAMINANHQVVGVWGRSEDNTNYISNLYNVEAYSGELIVPDETDICIICTADKAIKNIVSVLKTDAIVVHTSGSTDVNVLKPKFENFGVIYPVQTFTKGLQVDFKNVPLLIEYSNEQCGSKIQQLAASISQDVRRMNSQQRRYLHLCAIWACNFTNHTIATAKIIAEKNGVDYNLLKPLIAETINKALTQNPVKCQTGPAVRQDFEIMNFHLQLLEKYPELKNIYQILSDNIINFSKKY